MTQLCEHCGLPLPDSKPRGHARRFCSARCRVAHRRGLIVTDAPAIPVPVNRNTGLERARTDLRTAYDAYKASLLPEGSYRSLAAEAALTYDENGYPELPACLDRRNHKPVVEDELILATMPLEANEAA
jgi:hypothetical protein